METFDDRPLEREPLSQGEPAPTQKRANLTPIVIVTLVGLVLGAGAAWWWARGDRVTAPAPVTAATGSDTALPSSEEAPVALPPLDQMDTFLRTLLATLSAHPDFARWLATDDLIRQMARSIDRISRGQSPASDLPVFRPASDFAVTGPRNNPTVDADSYRRYDRLAAMVDSLDARAVADVYRTIYPRLDEAYRALGQTDSAVNQAAMVALQRLIDTPVPDGPVRLTAGRGATYAYADPQLERLSSAEKQLLRMGPENARLVQAKLREVKAAIEAAPPR
jgi:hypothetical protein